MTLVYILGKGSTWGNNELKYSLRSVETNLKGFDQIFVVGLKPSFLTNVTHIPCDDVLGFRQRSIFNKIMCAVNDDRVSDPFVHFADDYFILKETHVKDLGHYHNGLLSDRFKEYGGKYRQAMADTIEAGGVYNYDIHTPFVYTKELFKQNVASLDWSKEYVIKSAYMRSVKGDYREDCKLKLMRRGVKEAIRDSQFMSTGLLSPEMTDYIKRLFPVKSSYEV